VKFSEEEMLKLREYIQRGGTILAEPSDHSEAFTESIEELVRLMFPARYYPDYNLEPIADDHGVFTVLGNQWKERPKLRGISDGSRTFFFLSDGYMSADWQSNRSQSEAFPLAMHLLFYATDLGELKGKFTSIVPESPAVKKREEESFTVARVEIEGQKDPRDWDAAAMSWKAAAPYIEHVTGCTLEENSPVKLGEDSLDGIRLLHITGREKMKLSGDQRDALKAFVNEGGTLLVDAYAGSQAFADSARAELAAIFGELQPLATDSLLAEGRFEGGADLSRARFKLTARRILRARGDSTNGQKLEVALIGRRPAVVFSEFDLCSAMADIENFRSPGYKPKSAREIVGNIAAMLTVD